MKKTLEQWMKEIDAEVKKEIGVSVHDLPDCPFSDWHSAGKTAKAAAKKAIKNMSE